MQSLLLKSATIKNDHSLSSLSDISQLLHKDVETVRFDTIRLTNKINDQRSRGVVLQEMCKRIIEHLSTCEQVTNLEIDDSEELMAELFSSSTILLKERSGFPSKLKRLSLWNVYLSSTQALALFCRTLSFLGSASSSGALISLELESINAGTDRSGILMNFLADFPFLLTNLEMDCQLFNFAELYLISRGLQRIEKRRGRAGEQAGAAKVPHLLVGFKVDDESKHVYAAGKLIIAILEKQSLIHLRCPNLSHACCFKDPLYDYSLKVFHARADLVYDIC